MSGTATAPVRVQPMCRRFRGEPDQISLVRDFVRRHLERHDCPGAALDDILLCVTETATNAIQHTSSGSGGHFTVLLHTNGSAARVEVLDEGQVTAANEGCGGCDGDVFDGAGDEDDEYDELPPGGMGLRLVSAHSDRMGYQEAGRCGVAWFERTWHTDPCP